MSVFNSTKKFVANHYGKIAVIVGVGAVVYAWKIGALDWE
jgi:NADH:ubiquinone oxidoreductase subunit 3 (subunit A)